MFRINSIQFSSNSLRTIFFSGLFFDKHLKYIKLSDKAVDFSKKDLSYLLKENYDQKLVAEVYKLPVVTIQELRQGLVQTKGAVRIQYLNRNQFKESARSLGIMDDTKVIQLLTRLKNVLIFLIAEWSSKNGLSRYCVIIFQRPTCLLGTKYKLEGL